MKKITITVNEQQLNVIAKALGMMPYNEVVTLIAEISKQVKEQNETKAVSQS